MGYPLVSVSQTIDGKKRTLKMSQKRFLADGTTDEKNPLWQVPIVFQLYFYHITLRYYTVSNI